MAGAGVAGAVEAGAGVAAMVEAGAVEAAMVEAGMVEAGAIETAAGAGDRASPADTTTAAGIPGPGTLSAEAPVTSVIPQHSGSPPVIPAQAGVADARSGGVPPDHTILAEAAAPEPDQPTADQPEADRPTAGHPTADRPEAGQTEAEQPEAEQPEAGQADQSEADEVTPAELATDQRGPTPQRSPAPSVTALPTGVSENAEPLRLVRIGAEPDHEAWPEDPWLPGSRRPDRRALIIGVVLIAGLLSVASTAWLVKVNPPQASSPHGTHRSRPSQLGSGHVQPSQALSGPPTPILIQPSQPQPSQLQPSQLRPSQPQPTQPAPTQTGAGLAQTGHTGPSQPGHSQPGHDQPGHDQPGHNQSSNGHPGTSRSGTGHSRPGQPGASQTGTHRSGSGQPRPGRTGPGHAGTGGTTTPTAPHPRGPAPGSRGGATPRHPRPGVVSITPGLAGRADARRVGELLVRYFAAVNHRQYGAYASLFTQQRQLTPRDLAWGYRTNHDSNAVLVGIAPLRGGLKATVTFTSYQDPAQSPDHSSCIDWRIALFLHRTGATYLIGMPPPGYRAGLQACSFVPRQPPQGHSRHRAAKHSSSTRRSSQHPSSQHSATKHSASKHSATEKRRRGHR